MVELMLNVWFEIFIAVLVNITVSWVITAFNRYFDADDSEEIPAFVFTVAQEVQVARENWLHYIRKERIWRQHAFRKVGNKLPKDMTSYPKRALCFNIKITYHFLWGKKKLSFQSCFWQSISQSKISLMKRLNLNCEY